MKSLCACTTHTGLKSPYASVQRKGGPGGFNFPNKNNTCGHSWFGKVQQMIIATAGA